MRMNWVTQTKTSTKMSFNSTFAWDFTEFLQILFPNFPRDISSLCPTDCPKIMMFFLQTFHQMFLPSRLTFPNIGRIVQTSQAGNSGNQAQHPKNAPILLQQVGKPLEICRFKLWNLINCISWNCHTLGIAPFNTFTDCSKFGHQVAPLNIGSKGAGAFEVGGQTKEEFSINDTSRHPKLFKIGQNHGCQ